MTYPATAPPDPNSGQDPEQEPGGGDLHHTGPRKTPQAERYRRQRDEVFNLFSIQSQKIDSLIGAIDKLVLARETNHQAEPVRPKSNPGDPWSGLTDQELSSLSVNKEVAEEVRFGALQRLTQRQIDSRIKDVTREVDEQLNRKLQRSDQALRTESSIVQMYGPDAFNPATEFGALRKQYMDSFIQRFARSPGDDLSDHPVYQLKAVELAAEQLGIAKRVSPSPGSGAEAQGGGQPPQGQTTQVTSKSGPPPSARLSGGTEGAAVSSSKALEALKQKDTKAATRDFAKQLGF